MKIIITLPKGVEIPVKRMIPLLKWFQRNVNENIKGIHLERETK